MHLRTRLRAGAAFGGTEIIDVSQMLARNVGRFVGRKPNGSHVEYLVVVPSLGQDETVFCIRIAVKLLEGRTWKWRKKEGRMILMYLQTDRQTDR